METPLPNLIDYWREASRPSGIAEFCHALATLLAQRLPLAQMLVRWLDEDQLCLETVALGLPAGPSPDASRSAFEPATWTRLKEWCQHGGLLQFRPQAAASRDAALLIPADLQGEILAGPLRRGERPLGVLLVAALPGAPFDPRHREMVRMLLEPLAVALENDRRLRVMTALCEAALIGIGRRLDVAEALGTVPPQPRRTASPSGDAAASLAAEDDLPTLDEAMRRHIERALGRTAGRIEGSRGAAALLAINPHTLRARMRKLKIDWRSFRDGAAR